MATVDSRVFVITGGASGMGAATARLLARRGAAAVCIGDVNSDHFDEVKESVTQINPSTKVHCTCVDVTSSSAVDAWIQDIVATFGDLHGAANVAGITNAPVGKEPGNILMETDEDWDRIMGVNLNGIFNSTKAEVRAMKGLPTGQDRSIVNVASLASVTHSPNVFAYRTSKAGCAFFSSCVAKDTFPLGIRVNTVSPGATRTPMFSQFVPGAKTEEEYTKVFNDFGFEVFQPEDIARTIVWLLSEDSRPVFGANINVGAGVP